MAEEQAQDTTAPVEAPPPAPTTTVTATLDAAMARALSSGTKTTTAPEVSKPVEPPTVTVPVVAKPAEAPKDPNKAEIKGDPGAIGEIAKLSTKSRELAKKLEAVEPDAKLFAEVRALWKGGNRLEALAKLTGSDATIEVEGMLADYLKAPARPLPEDPPEPEATPVVKPDDVKKLVDERLQAEAKAGATKAAMGIAATSKDAGGNLRFELCSRPDNRREAAERAMTKAIELAQEQEVDLAADETGEESRRLLEEAYAVIEAEYEEIGRKRYVKGAPAAKPAVSGASAAPPVERAALSVQTPKRWLSHEEAEKRALEAARVGPTS